MLLDRFRQNTFASFLELEYYGTPRTGDELFVGEQQDGSRADRQWTGFSAEGTARGGSSPGRAGTPAS